MPRSTLLSLVLLGVGIALLVWGWNAHESFESDVSQTFRGKPSNESIVLIITGVLATAAGAVNLFRGGQRTR